MNEPALWDKLLKAAPKGSVLMGGAVVDYIAGYEPKDYDIFYPYHPGMGHVLPVNWVATDADFNDPAWVKKHDEQYLQGVDEAGNKSISVVFEFLVDNVYKVQLIGVNYANPLDHLKNFDHSLTLGWYTKNGLGVHRKVFESLDKKIITYVSKNHKKDAVERSLMRAKKKAFRYDGDDWQFDKFIVINKQEQVPGGIAL